MCPLGTPLTKACMWAIHADRYFGSFPVLGIVIPNAGAWLLPEFQDMGRTLQTTLQLPPDATIGHVFTLEPTLEGVPISRPSSERPEGPGLPCCCLRAICVCLKAGGCHARNRLHPQRWTRHACVHAPWGMHARR